MKKRFTARGNPLPNLVPRGIPTHSVLSPVIETLIDVEYLEVFWGKK